MAAENPIQPDNLMNAEKGVAAEDHDSESKLIDAGSAECPPLLEYPTYVRLKPPAGIRARPDVQARIVTSFIATEEDELSVKRGDIVELPYTESSYTGWWAGNINGKEGVFPSKIMQILRPKRSRKSLKSPVTAPLAVDPSSGEDSDSPWTNDNLGPPYEGGWAAELRRRCESACTINESELDPWCVSPTFSSLPMDLGTHAESVDDITTNSIDPELVDRSPQTQQPTESDASRQTSGHALQLQTTDKQARGVAATSAERANHYMHLPRAPARPTDTSPVSRSRARSQPGESGKKAVVALVLRSYTAQNEGELSLAEGERVKVVRGGQGLWEAEHKGKRGLVPSHVLTVLPAKHHKTPSQPLHYDENKQHVHRFCIRNEESFTSSHMESSFPCAVYVPVDALAIGDDNPVQTCVSVNPRKGMAAAFDSEHSMVGPTITFSPHEYQFRRPVVVFIGLPECYLGTSDHYDYFVAYRSSSSNRDLVWEDVSHYQEGHVTGVVLPGRGAMVLLLHHFSEFTIFRRNRKKILTAEAHGYWDQRCSEVTVTCLLRPEDYRMHRELYEDASRSIKGDLEDCSKLVVVKGDDNITMSLTDCDAGWTLESEEDRVQTFDGDILWNDHILWTKLFFRPTSADGTPPPPFLCRLSAQQAAFQMAKLRVHIVPKVTDTCTPSLSTDEARKPTCASEDLQSRHPRTRPPRKGPVQATNDISHESAAVSKRTPHHDQTARNLRPVPRPRNKSRSPLPLPEHQFQFQNGLDAIGSQSQPKNVSNASFQQQHYLLDLLPAGCFNYFTAEEKQSIENNFQTFYRETQPDRLRGITDDLIDMISDPDAIVDALYTRNMISDRQRQKMYAMRVDYEKNRSVLDIIRKHNNVEVLQEILRKKGQGHVATFIQKHLDGRCTGCITPIDSIPLAVAVN